ncbi:hypothetical protein FD754_008902 [Muntiacus muntjak]|uniref:Histone-lysine N-methyltransferase SETMAR n=1 Tax=Muntiacus muntjak TaxID=9888 RepID=A0A5N3WX15_MUNMU|nr:hypothetical protein FD754_008902 [Muntiacus muntjak]
MVPQRRNRNIHKPRTIEMMLDKKHMRLLFLFEFKTGCKLVEITININNTFGPGTANEYESLEDEECSGQPLEEVAQEFNIDHSMVVWHLKQIGKVKKFAKWVPHELTENQKDHCFEVSSSLTVHSNNKSLLNLIMTCDKKSRHFSQPTSHQKKKKKKKKIMVTVWYSAAHLIHCSFLNPGETITSEKYAQQIDEMRRKLQRLQPALVNRIGPLNKLGYKVLPHTPYSPDLLPTNYHFFKHLNNILQGKCFHNQQKAENAFQEFIESQGMDFYATEVNNLISHWPKCVDCNVSHFD